MNASVCTSILCTYYKTANAVLYYSFSVGRERGGQLDRNRLQLKFTTDSVDPVPYMFFRSLWKLFFPCIYAYGTTVRYVVFFLPFPGPNIYVGHKQVLPAYSFLGKQAEIMFSTNNFDLPIS